MNIGNAKLAFGLSIKLFDDILKGLHSKNVFPKQIEIKEDISIIDNLKATVFLKVELNAPYFHVDKYDPLLPLILEISGKVTPKIGFAEKISPDLFTVDFSGAVKLNIVLKNRTGQAPVIKLDYLGSRYVSEPFETKFIDNIFNTDEVRNVIDKLEFDVITPVLEIIANIIYFDTPNQKPTLDQFPLSLQRMRGGSNSRNAMVLFVGTPGTTLNTQYLHDSTVPVYSEFMMHAGPELITLMANKGKAKIEAFILDINKKIKPYTQIILSGYSLTVNQNQIDIYTEIMDPRSEAAVIMNGYFHFRHVPGMEKMFMDGSNVNISVELPWWAPFLSYFFPPIDDAIRYVEQDVPDIMQETITDLINNFMNNLDASIQLEGLEIEGMPVVVYPQEIKLDDNSITANIQILTWPITENLVNANYGKTLGKFIYFELENGRKYYVTDLAKFMHMGLVNVPGYHQVGQKYIRANPDNSESNNLESRFGR